MAKGLSKQVKLPDQEGRLLYRQYTSQLALQAMRHACHTCSARTGQQAACRMLGWRTSTCLQPPSCLLTHRCGHLDEPYLHEPLAHLRQVGVDDFAALKVAVVKVARHILCLCDNLQELPLADVCHTEQIGRGGIQQMGTLGTSM